VCYEQSLQRFIISWAKKIVAVYPNGCASVEDYIQEGYLKLAEICKDKRQKRNLQAYAIVAITRAMRDTAIKATFPLSAPLKVKTLAVEVRRRIGIGQSEATIRQQLEITTSMWRAICQLVKPEISLSVLHEPLCVDLEIFMALDDILTLPQLTDEDKILIRAQYNDDVDTLGLSRKQLWTKTRQICSKLNRSGYGT